mmetsp:Transcript_13538/g.38934  ORF Transcript_13538/g.38934 Transcript_13538/m.38934 type:complete len:277 (+) Transcript_13538:146-976(+)
MFSGGCGSSSSSMPPQPSTLPPAAMGLNMQGERIAPAGSLVDHPGLTQLSAMLKAIDAGDRIVKGRLELFCCSRRSLTTKAQQDLARRAPETITDSPLGPLSTDAAQNLLANLRSLMSLVFVDYDCSTITPNDFERCHDKHAVVAAINHSLAAVVDRVHSGFLGEFWQTVQEAIDVANCDIYAFRPTTGSFEPTDNSLMSLHYFFIDPLRGRILWIGCVTKSRGAVQGGVDSDSDVVLSQNGSNSSRQGSGSDMGSSLQEGEFAFSEQSDNDGMFD